MRSMYCSVAPRSRPRPVHRLCLLGALAAACHGPEPTATSGGEPAPGPTEPSYLVVYRPGPRWPGGDAMPPELREHFRYLLGLHQAGALQLAGPFAGETGGAAVLRARDDAAARALLQADPAVAAQVFDFELRRWSLVDWAARAERPAK
jgi:uncharacterized protein YciI